MTNEISFERKFKELILAIRIEKILDKEQILELYLNDIYLGFGSYGVASASLNYFNKDINNLNIEEMAFLAALHAKMLATFLYEESRRVRNDPSKAFFDWKPNIYLYSL